MNQEERQTLLSMPAWHDLLATIKKVTSRVQEETVAGMPRGEYYKQWKKKRAASFGRSPG